MFTEKDTINNRQFCIQIYEDKENGSKEYFKCANLESFSRFSLFLIENETTLGIDICLSGCNLYIDFKGNNNSVTVTKFMFQSMFISE